MSEGAMEGPQKLGPREKAIQYIQARDAERRKTIKLGGVRGTPESEVEIAAAAAYERVLDKLGDNGVKRALEGLRPVAYDLARTYRYTAKFADMAVTGALLFNPDWIPGLNRILPRRPAGETTLTSVFTSEGWRRPAALAAGVVGMVKLRPIEWAAKTAVNVAGVVIAEEAGFVNKVVDNIIGVKQPEAKPA